MLRSDDTDARNGTKGTDRVRTQAGSCQTAKRDGARPTPRTIPTSGRSPKTLMPTTTLPYVIGELKERIRTAPLKAAVSVNRELVLLYWQIGRDILARQKEHGWGAKVIDQLALDLRREFPGVEGFSPRNLKYMRAFAQAWPDESIVQ